MIEITNLNATNIASDMIKHFHHQSAERSWNGDYYRASQQLGTTEELY